MLACPNQSFTNARSAPASSKCVAIECFKGFDHGVGHPPLLLLGDAKAPNCRKNKAFNDLGHYSEWPKVADAVIKAIGAVAEQDVFACKIDLDGVDRLDPADEDLLMRAMLQTLLDRSLCIAEDTPEGRQLIFPSQYR